MHVPVLPLLAAASSALVLALDVILNPKPFGIGMSLSSGYGTVSAMFDNGTFIDIAKFEGNASYKAYMRTISDYSFSQRSVLPHQSQQRHSASTLVSCPLPTQFCRFWPLDSEPSGKPLSPMILALRNAAQTMLDQQVRQVEVAFSYVRDYSEVEAVLKSDLEDALKGAGLQTLRSRPTQHIPPMPYIPPMQNTHTAGALLSPADMSRCDYEADGTPTGVWKPRYLLVVENTRASLTVTLWDEQCDIYKDARELHSYDLGEESLEACFDEEREDCEPDLRAALQAVTRVPVRWNTGSPNFIETVVMFGESGANDKLNSVLRDILSKQQKREAEFIGELGHESAVDPSFTASRGAAKIARSMRRNSHSRHEEL